MIRLSIKDALRAVINSQLLASVKNNPDLYGIIRQLGYVQIDTISVIERAHHHVLWSRFPQYSPEQLKDLEESKRQVFEFWAHAASYLPMEDYRYTWIFKNNYRKTNKGWYKKDRKLMNRILDKIKSEGPVMSKDFEDTRHKKSKEPWEWKPAKVALHHLFFEGRIMVARRKGFQKIYDLPENVLPDWVDTSVPSKKEYCEYLVLRDIKSHGIMKGNEFGYLVKGLGQELRKTIARLVKNGQLTTVKLDGQANELFAHPDIVDLAESNSGSAVRILSPFDNLIIQRQRTKWLFDFDYVLECYVPPKKRTFGYFALPVLYRQNLVGKIDCKSDRKSKTMLLRNLELDSKVSSNDRFINSFCSVLNQFREFNQCESWKVEKKVKRLEIIKKLNLA